MGQDSAVDGLLAPKSGLVLKPVVSNSRWIHLCCREKPGHSMSYVEVGQ